MNPIDPEVLANFAQETLDKLLSSLGVPRHLTNGHPVSEEEAFLSELESGDESCLGVFADWLEDNNQPGRAAFVRRQLSGEPAKLNTLIFPYPGGGASGLLDWCVQKPDGRVIKLDPHPHAHWRHVTAGDRVRYRLYWPSTGALVKGQIINVCWGERILLKSVLVEAVLNHPESGYTVQALV